MEYKEAVAEARTLVKRSEEDQWRLADLTYEVVQAGATRRQWADDLEVSHTHVNTLYRLGEEWRGKQLSARPKFAGAYARIHTPGRYEESGVTGSLNAAGAARTVRNMPPEQKAEVVREALDDLPPEQAASLARHALRQPEVADRVMRDHDTRRTVRDADDRYHVDHQREAKERYELAEPRSVQIGAMTAGEYDLTKARRGFEDALDNAATLERHGWPDDSRERFAALTRRAIASGQILLAKLEGRDLDTELAELLRSEG